MKGGLPEYWKVAAGKGAKGNNESEAMTDIDAYDLAMLAAQLMCRQNAPAKAVETAWSLLDEAKLKLDGVQLQALAESPEAQAQSEKREAERLANLQIHTRRASSSLLALIDGQGNTAPLSGLRSSCV
jgi:hypothetical protein